MREPATREDVAVLVQAADLLADHPELFLEPAAHLWAPVFRAWARMGNLDPDLINRVGGRETLEVARAVLDTAPSEE